MQLVEAPRKVGQIAISYARTSKQVGLRPASHLADGREDMDIAVKRLSGLGCHTEHLTVARTHCLESTLHGCPVTEHGPLHTACCISTQTKAVRVQVDAAQVDVRVLKEDLWSSLQQLEPAAASPLDADEPAETSQSGMSFQQVISNMDAANSSPNDRQQQGEVSVQLCFICMLHLANEHGLQITGVPTLDSMSVVLPP